MPPRPTAVFGVAADTGAGGVSKGYRVLWNATTKRFRLEAHVTHFEDDVSSQGSLFCVAYTYTTAFRASFCTTKMDISTPLVPQ